MSTAGLHRVPEAELVRLTRAIAREDFASPVTRAALVLAKFGHLEADLDVLVGHDKKAALAVLVAVLRERQRAPLRAVVGVWSGPPPTGQGTRAPYDTLLELIATAERSILVTGIDLARDERLLRALHSAQRGRELSVTIILDDAASRADVGALRDQRRALFRERMPWPDVYVADRERVQSAVPLCMFVDRQRGMVLAGAAPAVEAPDSALTQGVLIEDGAVAEALCAQWQLLIDSAAFVPLTAASAP